MMQKLCKTVSPLPGLFPGPNKCSIHMLQKKRHVRKNIHHTDNCPFLWEPGRYLEGRVMNKQDFSSPINLVFMCG